MAPLCIRETAQSDPLELNHQYKTMIKTIVLLVFACCVIQPTLYAQWNPSGDSFTTGRIGINRSVADYDIDISRNVEHAGIRIFNTLGSGRSLIVFGESYGGKYGYVAHHGQTHNAGSGVCAGI